MTKIRDAFPQDVFGHPVCSISPSRMITESDIPNIRYRYGDKNPGIECRRIEAFLETSARFPVPPTTINRVHFYCFMMPDYDGRHTIDFLDVDFHAGDLLMVKAGQTHAWSRHAEHARGRLLLVSPDVFEKTAGLLAGAGFSLQLSRMLMTPARQALLAELFDQLGREIKAGVSPDALRLLLGHWLMLALGDEAEQGDASERRHFARLDALLRQDLSQTPVVRRTVAEYASLLGISSDHLSVVVKGVTGMSAKARLDKELALEAQRRLATTVLPVNAIASAMGFSEPTHFSQFMRRVTSATPMEFRRRLRAG